MLNEDQEKAAKKLGKIIWKIIAAILTGLFLAFVFIPILEFISSIEISNWLGFGTGFVFYLVMDYILN